MVSHGTSYSNTSLKKNLSPCSSVILVEGSNLINLSPAEITAETIGLKAFGLASIPQVWSKPFFVVAGDETPTEECLFTALQESRLNLCHRVIVRSSGVMESMDERGSLESGECEPTYINLKIAELKVILANRKNIKKGLVHWIIQEFIPTTAKGHLSNERHLREAPRDWVVEVEAATGHPSELQSVAIRTWRDARKSEPQELYCNSRYNFHKTLEKIARWAYDLKYRIHFEWVWDSKKIYLVQADECHKSIHVANQIKSVLLPKSSSFKDITEVFYIANSKHYSSYRKLKNTNLYRDIGYNIPDFYILEYGFELSKILDEGLCSDKLILDLESLTKLPLVIRTDGLDIPDDKYEMLPRSDELRSGEAAKRWLLNEFKDTIIKLSLDKCQLCLIAHHFVPASASAWCQAYPANRRVRIESLWGIPEGLYFYAHDVFDVDTITTSIPPNLNPPESISIKEKLRYKRRFVAPDDSGNWVVHQTNEKTDWQPSIKQERWIKEIAWKSRCIAAKEQKPVVVMWLIDIPKARSTHAVMPWFHLDWKNEAYSPKAAPRKKLSSSIEFVLRTEADWETLQENCRSGKSIVRVVLDPAESTLIRNQLFLTTLAALAKEKSFVVELSGGILSHAYYLLTSSGCEVECVDLYATEDDEIEFNKLVRDKIPDNIKARGENVELLRLEGEALIAALKRKVVEEAFEVVDSKTTQQMVEELADLREVMDALKNQLGISEKDVKKVQNSKAKSRGGFNEGLMLTRTVLASSLGEDESAKDDPLMTFPQSKVRTISHETQLPPYNMDMHVDKRHNAQGTAERQVTLTLPTHANIFKHRSEYFYLETQDGHRHELTLEVTLERNNADLRCKLRLINAPVQLELPMFEKLE